MDNKDNIICYDIAMVPDGMDIERLFTIAKEFNYLFYDSSIAPSFAKVPYLLDGKKMTKYLVDVSTIEGKNKLKYVLDGK